MDFVVQRGSRNCIRARVKTHKSQKSLRPSRFRLPESLEGIRKERVGSTSYAFMSLDPSTTLADLFVLPFCADPLSAVRALMRRQSNDEIDDGSAHGWQAGLRWWLRFRSTGWREGAL